MLLKIAFVNYSCRSASIGSNADAFRAGYQPKNTPTKEQKRNDKNIEWVVIRMGQPMIFSTVFEAKIPNPTPIMPPMSTIHRCFLWIPFMLFPTRKPPENAATAPRIPRIGAVCQYHLWLSSKRKEKRSKTASRTPIRAKKAPRRNIFLLFLTAPFTRCMSIASQYPVKSRKRL